MYTTSSRLKELRKEKKVTQVQMGNILGIRPNMYQRYEYGLIELPVRHAKRLGKYFGFDRWLLYEDEGL